ncbi:hydroxymethylbilane synthase [Pelosinus fermentans]|uniref:Porphobilinogen deaminase n=1 Tax=Pelosinus fermentans JBW45 TaxID=1192197 RepID=I9NW86_9FIRM|nr:hydroxymethylbilane synthase [Pelosinus fermentans]AJQ29818.1 Porphobilinogen deaminase [Pelosinus fermentans JBW45]
MKRKKITIGTRGSKLALWQANHIADCIRAQYPDVDVELLHIVTTGDKILDVPLARIGGKGLFTKELETAMLNGQIDLAVHSLKDMPTELPEGLLLAAITERVDPGDAFISPNYGTVDNLPKGARVGTSSLRRKAQLLKYRSDLKIGDLRGNLDTRLKKLENGEFDGIILAVAGLKRLGWQEKITQVLPQDICLPAVGQGALAIEARSNDAEVLQMLAFLNHQETRWSVEAERAYLAEVEGGCQIPIGVFGRIEQEILTLEAAILSVDGARQIRQTISGSPQDGKKLGRDLAQRMLDEGGREILQELEVNH